MSTGYAHTTALLRLARERHGLRQQDVAVRLNVSQFCVSQWERGCVDPSAHRLALWADAVGYNLTVIRRWWES